MIKMIKNKVVLIIYLGISFLILSSCTNAREIKDLAMVSIIGMDKEGDDVVLTCEISNPLYSSKTDGASSTSYSVVFVQGKGKTFFDAGRNLTLHFDKQLFFSHANIIIIGEELAKEGITQNLDYLLRAQGPRENIKMLIAKGTKAYEVMGVMGELSGSGGEYISGMLDNFSLNGKTIDISLSQYYRYYYGINNEPVIGVVQKEERKGVPGEVKKSGPTKTILNIGGGAVTKRDYLIGYFSPDEMFGFNFIVNDIKGGAIVFTTPSKLTNNMSVIGNQGKLTSIEILKSQTKNDIKIKDGNIHLDINVKLRGSLIEENRAIDLDDEEFIAILEDDCSKEVEKIISRTLDKGQREFKQDNFSIGEAVHQKYPEVWREIEGDWDNIFSEMTYSVNVKTEIVKIGIINVPSNLRKWR